MSERSDWPIVVGGCHRSGTSVIRRILDTHSRIHCGPEILFFRDFYDEYPEDPLRHLRFATTARSILPEAELFELLGDAFLALHARAAAKAGKLRWADKVPENVLHTGDWERLLGQRWLFVHVVRNPLDTLASMHDNPFPLTLPADLEGRIAFYRRYTESGLTFSVSCPDRHRRVIYEELVETPERVVRALMEWLGERFEPTQLAFNSVPHQLGAEDPSIASTMCVHDASVGRWRSILTAEQAALIWERTADLWSQIDPECDHVTPPGSAGGQHGHKA